MNAKTTTTDPIAGLRRAYLELRLRADLAAAGHRLRDHPDIPEALTAAAMQAGLEVNDAGEVRDGQGLAFGFADFVRDAPKSLGFLFEAPMATKPSTPRTIAPKDMGRNLEDLAAGKVTVRADSGSGMLES